MKTFIQITMLLLITQYVLRSQDPGYHTSSNLPCAERKFFMYFHVALDSLGKSNVSPGKIKTYLDQLNKAFEPICISFDYCKIDTITDYSFDEINDGFEVLALISRFQKKNRINVYLVDTVWYDNSVSNYFSLNTPDSCYVIIPKSGVGFEHELGHIFGLLHTHETFYGKEKVDGSNCTTTGDKICDTPADPKVKLQKCIFESKKKDVNGDFYQTEIGNFMTHYFCAHCFFSHEQYELMAKNYLTKNIKIW
jgi:hypothetical protein